MKLKNNLIVKILNTKNYRKILKYNYKKIK